MLAGGREGLHVAGSIRRRCSGGCKGNCSDGGSSSCCSSSSSSRKQAVAATSEANTEHVSSKRYSTTWFAVDSRAWYKRHVLKNGRAENIGRGGFSAHRQGWVFSISGNAVLF